MRNLEEFYHCSLKKHSDAFATIDLKKIAIENDAAGLTALLGLVVAAAVTCEDRGTFINRVMELPPDAQAEMKNLIQETMPLLQDYADENEEDEKDETEVMFNDDGPGDSSATGGPVEMSELQVKELEEVRRELNRQKAWAKEVAEESEKAQGRLQAIVDDLHDRLTKRQDELINVEEELQMMTSNYEEAKSQVAQLEEEKSTLADDLDLAKTQAQKLYRAEATVLAYKKKLDTVGVMNQQMEDLEGQAEKYVRQINQLEAEVKRANALQKTVTAQEAKLAELEKQLSQATTSEQSAAKELDDWKSRCQAAENAKKMFEGELDELRAKNQVGGVVHIDSPNGDQLQRVQLENQQLRKQVENLSVAAAPTIAFPVSTDGSEPIAPIAIAVPASDDTPETAALKLEIQRLYQAFVIKEKENSKVSAEKEKLEAYTKRTLARFQDKYLVALQECKAKLKEKQDKIESLEKKGHAERQSQKREERLLSSALYELGLGIMQTKLKGEGQK
jgi:DNA repair exonuclease SbcCD ATPase subunit